MLLPFKGHVGHRNSLFLKRIHHHFRLIRRHDFIFKSLEKGHGAIEPIDVMNGRSINVDILALRVGANQSIEVASLELMGISGQGFQIAHAVVAGSGLELVTESQSGQGGVAPGAAPGNGQAIAIHQSPIDQILRTIHAIIHIHQPPLAIQPAMVGAAIARAAAIVHIQHRKAATRPILDRQIQTTGSLGRGAAVNLDFQRRLFALRCLEITIFRQIQEGIGFPIARGGKRDRLRFRQIARINF